MKCFENSFRGTQNCTVLATKLIQRNDVLTLKNHTWVQPFNFLPDTQTKKLKHFYVTHNKNYSGVHTRDKTAHQQTTNMKVRERHTMTGG